MIESGEESQVAIAFFIGAGVMALGGVVELLFGVKAEQQELEGIAKPLTAEEAEGDRPRSGRVGSSRGMPVSAPVPPVGFEREVAAIEQALAANGTVDRRRLAGLVGARFWGPGRFQGALRAAVRSGRARRVGRSAFAAAPRDRG
jgi:hypothetical protein